MRSSEGNAHQQSSPHTLPLHQVEVVFDESQRGIESIRGFSKSPLLLNFSDMPEAVPEDPGKSYIQSGESSVMIGGVNAVTVNGKRTNDNSAMESVATRNQVTNIEKFRDLGLMSENQVQLPSDGRGSGFRSQSPMSKPKSVLQNLLRELRDREQAKRGDGYKNMTVFGFNKTSLDHQREQYNKSQMEKHAKELEPSQFIELSHPRLQHSIRMIDQSKLQAQDLLNLSQGLLMSSLQKIQSQMENIPHLAKTSASKQSLTSNQMQVDLDGLLNITQSMAATLSRSDSHRDVVIGKPEGGGRSTMFGPDTSPITRSNDTSKLASIPPFQTHVNSKEDLVDKEQPQNGQKDLLDRYRQQMDSIASEVDNLWNLSTLRDHVALQLQQYQSMSATKIEDAGGFTSSKNILSSDSVHESLKKLHSQRKTKTNEKSKTSDHEISTMRAVPSKVLPVTNRSKSDDSFDERLEHQMIASHSKSFEQTVVGVGLKNKFKQVTNKIELIEAQNQSRSPHAKRNNLNITSENSRNKLFVETSSVSRQRLPRYQHLPEVHDLQGTLFNSRTMGSQDDGTTPPPYMQPIETIHQDDEETVKVDQRDNKSDEMTPNVPRALQMLRHDDSCNDRLLTEEANIQGDNDANQIMAPRGHEESMEDVADEDLTNKSIHMSLTPKRKKRTGKKRKKLAADPITQSGTSLHEMSIKQSARKTGEKYLKKRKPNNQDLDQSILKQSAELSSPKGKTSKKKQRVSSKQRQKREYSLPRQTIGLCSNVMDMSNDGNNPFQRDYKPILARSHDSLRADDLLVEILETEDGIEAEVAEKKMNIAADSRIARGTNAQHSLTHLQESSTPVNENEQMKAIDKQNIINNVGESEDSQEAKNRRQQLAHKSSVTLTKDKDHSVTDSYPQMPEPLRSIAQLIQIDQQQVNSRISAETLINKLKEIYQHNLYVQRSLALMAMSLERAQHDSQVQKEEASVLLNSAISRLKQLQAQSQVFEVILRTKNDHILIEELDSPTLIIRNTNIGTDEQLGQKKQILRDTFNHFLKREIRTSSQLKNAVERAQDALKRPNAKAPITDIRRDQMNANLFKNNKQAHVSIEKVILTKQLSGRSGYAPKHNSPNRIKAELLFGRDAIQKLNRDGGVNVLNPVESLAESFEHNMSRDLLQNIVEQSSGGPGIQYSVKFLHTDSGRDLGTKTSETDLRRLEINHVEALRAAAPSPSDISTIRINPQPALSQVTAEQIGSPSLLSANKHTSSDTEPTHESYRHQLTEMNIPENLRTMVSAVSKKTIADNIKIQQMARTSTKHLANQSSSDLVILQGKTRPAAQPHERIGQLAFSGISNPIVDHECAVKAKKKGLLVNETDLMKLSAELLEGMNKPSFAYMNIAEQRKFDRVKARMQANLENDQDCLNRAYQKFGPQKKIIDGFKIRFRNATKLHQSVDWTLKDKPVSPSTMNRARLNASTIVTDTAFKETSLCKQLNKNRLAGAPGDNGFLSPDRFVGGLKEFKIVQGPNFLHRRDLSMQPMAPLKFEPMNPLENFTRKDKKKAQEVTNFIEKMKKQDGNRSTVSKSLLLKEDLGLNFFYEMKEASNALTKSLISDEVVNFDQGDGSPTSNHERQPRCTSVMQDFDALSPQQYEELEQPNVPSLARVTTFKTKDSPQFYSSSISTRHDYPTEQQIPSMRNTIQFPELRQSPEMTSPTNTAEISNFNRRSQLMPAAPPFQKKNFRAKPQKLTSIKSILLSPTARVLRDTTIIPGAKIPLAQQSIGFGSTFMTKKKKTTDPLGGKVSFYQSRKYLGHANLVDDSQMDPGSATATKTNYGSVYAANYDTSFGNQHQKFLINALENIVPEEERAPGTHMLVDSVKASPMSPVSHVDHNDNNCMTSKLSVVQADYTPVINRSGQHRDMQTSVEVLRDSKSIINSSKAVVLDKPTTRQSYDRQVGVQSNMLGKLMKPVPLALTQLAHTKSGEQFDLPSASFKQSAERKSEVQTIVDNVEAEGSQSKQGGSIHRGEVSPGLLDPPTLCVEQNEESRNLVAAASQAFSNQAIQRSDLNISDPIIDTCPPSKCSKLSLSQLNERQAALQLRQITSELAANEMSMKSHSRMDPSMQAYLQRSHMTSVKNLHDSKSKYNFIGLSKEDAEMIAIDRGVDSLITISKSKKSVEPLASKSQIDESSRELSVMNEHLPARNVGEELLKDLKSASPSTQNNKGFAWNSGSIQKGSGKIDASSSVQLTEVDPMSLTFQQEDLRARLSYLNVERAKNNQMVVTTLKERGLKYVKKKRFADNSPAKQYRHNSTVLEPSSHTHTTLQNDSMMNISATYGLLNGADLMGMMRESFYKDKFNQVAMQTSMRNSTFNHQNE